MIANQRAEPLVGLERVSGGARAAFLSQSEVDAAYDFPLLVQVLERGFHLAVEKHPAVDFDALLLAEIFGLADGRDGRAQVTGDLVANRVSITHLAEFNAGPFEAIVENCVRTLGR